MDSPEIQVVGELSEAAALLVDLPSAQRTVHMRASTVTHLRHRRPERDVQFALKHLSAAIAHPRMVGRERQDVRRYRLILVLDDGPWLHVSLKLVPASAAASQVDELWVSTAFPMGRSLTKIGNKPTLWWIVE